MRRFIIYCFCYAAELCVRRMLFEQGSKDTFLSYQEVSEAAMSAADAALHYWKENKR